MPRSLAFLHETVLLTRVPVVAVLPSVVVPTTEPIPFGEPNKFRLRVDYPLTKAVLAALHIRFPEACRISDVLEEAATALALPQDERAAARFQTTAELLRAWSLNLIHFYVNPPRPGLVAPERPEVWAPTRYQCQAGHRTRPNTIRASATSSECSTTLAGRERAYRAACAWTSRDGPPASSTVWSPGLAITSGACEWKARAACRAT